MRLSIAIATFNGAAFIKDQLKSLASQTLLPFEVIVTDDQSSDETVSLINQFAQTAPFPIRVETNESNIGYGRNFSKAISKTCGDIVFLSDQDDVWLPDKLATIAAAFERSPDQLCIMCDAMLTDVDLNPIGATKREQLRKACQPDSSFVMGCCAAFSGAFLKRALPLPETLHAHDSWLIGLTDLLSRTQRLDTPLQYYRRHVDSVSQILVNSSRNRSAQAMFLHNALMRLMNLPSSHRILYEREVARAQRDWLQLNSDFADDGLESASTLLGRLDRHIEYLERRINLRRLQRLARARLIGAEVFIQRLPLRSIIKDLLASPIVGDTYDPRSL